MVVGNARLTGVFLVVDEPNLGLSLVMLRQPGAPLLAAGDIQRLAYFHFVRSAEVEDNERRRAIPLTGRASAQGKQQLITVGVVDLDHVVTPPGGFAGNRALDDFTAKLGKPVLGQLDE